MKKMVSILLRIDNDITKKVKQFMLDNNITSKEKAIIQVLEDKFGGKKK